MKFAHALLALAALAVPFTAAPAQKAPSAAFDWLEYSGSDPTDELSAPAPDQYRNPILQGFYPDPSIVRVGEDYYLTNSTFGYFSGLPVFHSRDLVNWTQIANAIDRPGQLRLGTGDMMNGPFAPAIQHRDGVFYIVNTCFKCGWNYVITSTNPAGPWSDPVWLPKLGEGIDPSIFFDEGTGRAWIVNNDIPPEGERYSGHRAIFLQEFDAKNLRTFGPRTVILDAGIKPAEEPGYVEGPHIFKRGDWYYLTAAEGGTGDGHRQVILRSRTVTGPYVAKPANPILTQMDLPAKRPFPVTSTGHADFFNTPKGDWYAVFLGVRPYKGGHFNTGRETFMLPVSWKDDWPEILPPRTVVPLTSRRPDLPRGSAPLPTNGPFTIRDDFAGNALPLHYVMRRMPTEQWFSVGGGKLVINGRAEGLSTEGNPSFLGRRLQHQQVSTTTLMDYAGLQQGDVGGLAIGQNEKFWMTVQVERTVEGARVAVRRRAGANDPVKGTLLGSAALPAGRTRPIRLRIDGSGGDYSFLFASQDGPWQIVAEKVDGTILSSSVAGGFQGAVVGPFVTDGGADQR